MKFEEFYNALAVSTIIEVWEESELVYSNYHRKKLWKLAHIIDIVKGEYPSKLEINNRKIALVGVNIDGELIVTLEAKQNETC